MNRDSCGNSNRKITSISMGYYKVREAELVIDRWMDGWMDRWMDGWMDR